MPAERLAVQLVDDLRALVRGRFCGDDLTRTLYSTDASPFQILPLGVVIPADEADLCTVVKYAHEHGIPITARGAGTGLAGESLGPGLIVDLSVHFRRILEVGPDFVRVEPGVTYSELATELAKHGRRFAPNPANGASCTLGGMIATNASGDTAFRHGYTRDYVRDLRIVWDDGTAETLSECGPRTTAVRNECTTLLRENRDIISITRPHTAFNRCGYVLDDVVVADGANLAKLFVGSEGTFGIIAEATLRTVPLPGGVCLALLGFASFDCALKAGVDLKREPGIVGCDLLDQRLLSLSRTAKPESGVTPVPSTVGAVLVAMWEAETERDAVAFGRDAVERLRVAHRISVLTEPTCEPADVARIQAFRESVVMGLYALGRGRRPEAFVEDTAVPTEELAAFVAGVQEILRTDDTTASFLIHVLAGQVHTRPFVDLNDEADRAKMWSIAERVHALAIAHSGTISSQHGTGLARTPWVEKQYGPQMPVFRELKRIFDPKNILNPGKIVGPDPSRPAWPLRAVVVSPERQTLLIWNDSPTQEAAKCNGCGDCRPRATTTRMCPIFLATGEEAATPRAKANILRQTTDEKELLSDDVRELAKLCVNCKMCRDECRAKVDIPKLMLETKAALYEEHGLDRRDWLLARAETLSRWASFFAFSTNVILSTRWSRWLLEKVFGLSRYRRLPRFAHRTFLRRARRAGWTVRNPKATGRKFAYFVDVYANAIDPQIGEATVAVLQHHGFDVLVPRRQRGSGMTPLSYGDVDTARAVARYNVRTFAELVREGYTVVCSEPTAALALTHDYLDYLDDPDAKLVAANTVELMTLLGELQIAGTLKSPIRDVPFGVGHHVPCHLKALRGGAPGPKLLATIPGMQVHTLDVSCSGMAGTWGLAARNREASLAAGRPMLEAFDRPRATFGATECSACRMQMQDATGKRTLHPVQYLAYAYGLLPDLEASLTIHSR